MQQSIGRSPSHSSSSETLKRARQPGSRPSISACRDLASFATRSHSACDDWHSSQVPTTFPPQDFAAASSTKSRLRSARTHSIPFVMIFVVFPPFLCLSPKRPHSFTQTHDMFPHSPSYLISCPFPFILSFIFFRSFWLEGKLGHLGLLGLKNLWPMGRQYRGLSILEQCRHPLQGS